MNYPEHIYVDTDLVGQELPREGWQKYQRVDEIQPIPLTEEQSRVWPAVYSESDIEPEPVRTLKNCRWQYNFEAKLWETGCGNHINLEESTTISGFCVYCGKPIVI
jgi:hypothetical protein